MARKRESSKHPAIMANKVAAAESATAIDVTTTGSDTLTSDQKRFVSLYGIHHDVVRTATAANVSLAWVKEQSKDNPSFSDILKYGVPSVTDVGTKMMKMAIPYTVMRLLDMIEKEPNNQIVLAAIKHLHDATGMNQKMHQGFGGNFMNVNIKLPAGMGKEDKVIDVERE